MTLMMRITRLFKADMHGLLDLLEEPEAVLKQAIRDMESEIGQGQQTLAERRQREERLRRASTQLESSINAYEEQIDIAFEAQNDDLARTFIRKKLEAEKRLQATVRAIADMAAETDALQNRVWPKYSNASIYLKLSSPDLLAFDLIFSPPEPLVKVRLRRENTWR